MIIETERLALMPLSLADLQESLTDLPKTYQKIGVNSLETKLDDFMKRVYGIKGELR